MLERNSHYHAGVCRPKCSVATQREEDGFCKFDSGKGWTCDKDPGFSRDSYGIGNLGLFQTGGTYYCRPSAARLKERDSQKNNGGYVAWP